MSIKTARVVIDGMEPQCLLISPNPTVFYGKDTVKNKYEDEARLHKRTIRMNNV